MANTVLPLSSDIYLEVDGKKVAVVQSYTTRATRTSREIEAFGENEPVATIAGANKYTLPVASTATLGGAVEVPTITGRARLNIAPGTQPGKVLRLRGKGLPEYNSRTTGDELINVMVYIPETLTDDEKKAFEAMRDNANMKPSESTKHRLFSKLKHIFE